MPMTTPSPWWSSHIHTDRRPFLLGRNRILSRFRAFFDGEEFVEVDPCALQNSPGNEAHLHAFTTQAVHPDGRTETLYLHTSPEFACKKLLAAGEPRIVSFGHVFRNRERGPLHHPEFTMIEWYRTGESYEALMKDCARLAKLAVETTGTKVLSYRGRSADPFLEPERLAVGEAFSRYANIDVMATLKPGCEPDRDALQKQAMEVGIRTADDDTWSDIFSRVLVEKIEPRLGDGRLTILDRYPTHEAALARPCADDPRVAERFELYACGVELANAFGELTDADEQHRRFETEMAEKLRIYGETYPIDEDFIAALATMPEASGAALGFERLAMLALGATRIDQVIWTPMPRPSHG